MKNEAQGTTLPHKLVKTGTQEEFTAATWSEAQLREGLDGDGHGQEIPLSIEITQDDWNSAKGGLVLKKEEILIGALVLFLSMLLLLPVQAQEITSGQTSDTYICAEVPENHEGTLMIRGQGTVTAEGQSYQRTGSEIRHNVYNAQPVYRDGTKVKVTFVKKNNTLADGKESPRTGDYSQTRLWRVIMEAAAAVVLLCGFIRGPGAYRKR